MQVSFELDILKLRVNPIKNIIISVDILEGEDRPHKNKIHTSLKKYSVTGGIFNHLSENRYVKKVSCVQ